MEDSWRFRPIQGNVCPTCSISHFPFCPHPRSFDPSFHRPIGLPIDDYNTHTQLTRTYRDAFGYDPSLNFDYNDRTVKRIRIGDGVPALGMFPPTPFRSGLSAEDERRLSLIRDHGAPTATGMDSGYVGGEANRLNGYSYESSLGDWQARSSTNGLYDTPGSSRERMLHQEYALDNHNYVGRNNGFGERKGFGRGEHGVGYGHQIMQSDVDGFRSGKEPIVFPNMEERGRGSSFALPDEPRLQPNYYESDNFRHSGVPAGHPRYGTILSHREDSPGYFQGEIFQQPLNSQHGSYPGRQKSHIMYDDNDSLHLQPKGFNQAQEFSHTSVFSSQLPGAGMLLHEMKQTLNTHRHQNDLRQAYDVRNPSMEDYRSSIGPHNSSMLEQFDTPKIHEHEHERGTYLPIHSGNSLASCRQVDELNSRGVGVYPPLTQSGTVGVYPPLPPSPPPSLPLEPPGPPPAHIQARVSPPTIPPPSSDVAPNLHPSAFEGRHLPPKNTSPEKPKIIDASSLFKRPSRDTRPDHIVVILRGLPGSGKSYLAKMLRDFEVENGANAPRIHSMDDYFMTEVEKVEESEVSKSSSTSKSKKRVLKKVMEYCYEPEMEEAYRSSMLKAFKKTLEDGEFTFVIVDDRNLRIADFAQFWASAKRCGYEVYLLEAMYKDPVGCAARNIHGFTSDDIQKMAALWEEAPSLYLRLDIQSLFHGDDLEEHGIQEVDMDMDMDDVACDEGQSGMQNRISLKTVEAPEDHFYDDSLKDEKSDAEGDDPGVKQLGSSKWSNDAEEEDAERSERAIRDSNALSGLIHAYTKGDKSVHWGDQVGKTGFSISANKRAKVLSLVIGPGAGYNLKSNPLPEEETEVTTDISWQAKKRSAFEEQLRAERASERESFKSTSDRRRHRIGGFGIEDNS